MKFVGDINSLEKGIGILNINNDETVVSVKKGECLKVVGNDGGYSIEYENKSDFFRGMSVLHAQIESGEKNFVIEEKRRFDMCGVMIDVSRNAVLKPETVKDVIRYMARMGLNMLMLYTEDTYKMEKYPYFGYMRGAYTIDEIREIVDYAEIFDIEVIPCIQTLGHLGRALQWDYAIELRDKNDILLVDEPKVYEFIEEMIKTMRMAYKTNRIHIGMDEAYDTGLGRYLALHGYEERFNLVTRHLKRIDEILRKYDFDYPLMWNDLIFDEHTPDNVKEILPENVETVLFNYSYTEKEQYTASIKMHTDKDCLPMFAGGVKVFNAIAPNYLSTFATSIPALESCIENGVKDVMTTVWGDDGTECNIYTSLPGLQIYAEMNYEGNTSRINEMFKACTGYELNEFLMMGIDNFDKELCPTMEAGTSKQVFYQDILQGMIDKNLAEFDFKSYYSEYREKFKDIIGEGKFKYLFDYYKVLFDILYVKCDLGINLTRAYKENNLEEMKKLISDMDILVEKYLEIHKMAKDIWYNTNKPFGFEVLDFRLGGMQARIKTAKERVMQYISGNISSIPELEEERLWYSGFKTAFPRGLKGWTSTEVLTPSPIKGA